MKTKTCPDCDGDGVADKGTDDEHQCPTCGGSGLVPDDDDPEEVLNTSSMIAQQKHWRVGHKYRAIAAANSGSLGNIGRDTPGFVISERLPTEATYHFCSCRLSSRAMRASIPLGTSLGSS